MDRMDEYLSKLPGQPPAEDLAARILQTIQTHRKRRRTVRRTLSILLALSGVWLVFPLLAASLLIIEIPASGLPLLSYGLEALAADLSTLFVQTTDGLLAIQTSLFTSLGLSSWLGMVCLAAGTLIWLERLLPRDGDYPYKHGERV